MTLNAAMNVLAEECAFLGKTWEELFSLLKSKPTIFPERAVRAFEVYKAEIGEK